MILSRANFATFFTSLAIQACGAGTGVMTARLLGPAARGELSTVILWPMILSNLGLLGCNCALARQVAGEPGNERHWVAAGLRIGATSAPLFYVLGYFLLPLVLPADKGYLLPLARICLLMIPLDTFNQLLLSAEQGRMRWRRYNLLRLSFFIFYLGFIGFLGITRRSDVRWFVAAFLASHLLAMALRVLIQRQALIAGAFQPERCRHLLRSGMPFFGATVSNLAALQFDTVLVVSLLNTKAAGIYVVASALANGQSSIGEALGITSFAALSNETDPRIRERILTGTFRQSALVTCAMGLAVSCAIPFSVVPLFGRAFSQAIWPGAILALGASTGALGNILNQGLRGAGMPHAGVASQVLGIVCVALAAAALLRRFGLIGMAIAVFLSACVQLLVLVAFAARWLKVSPLEFWPFGAGNVRLFGRQLVDLRLRDSRSPA